MQIAAILSDYDGTLCSTINVMNSSGNKIPVELYAVLSEISKHVPVCVISSKDFGFLCDKIKFARIVSCIMRLETIILRRQLCNELIHIKNDSNVIFNTRLTDDIDTLTNNSVLLSSLAEEISQAFKEISVYHEFTSKERILAGITLDYRHLEDWLTYKTNSEPFCLSGFNKP
ncbi:MAG TPA: hypothetical protein VFI73_10090 [Candidatus Nitrosopolaris sp.]|nr:hypothetical protein [Candidatus Nitrosopolaris sp.]